MEKIGIYFHPETFQAVKPLGEIELTGSLPDFEYRRGVIRGSHQDTLELRSTGIEQFTSVHDGEYIDSIVKLSRGEKAEITISMECQQLYYFIPGYEYSLGGVCAAVDTMKSASKERAYCYALPSHHAYPAKGHGYCLLNTLAAGVRYAQSQGFRNNLIVDWDHHHGDGTQTIFEYDRTVHQISIHSAIDIYMGMMRAHKLGTTTYGEKVGHRNIPVLDVHYDEAFFNECEMEGEYYRHDTCLARFREALEDLPFAPDMIWIFDGHDAHREDLGADVARWDYDDFALLTKAVLDISRKYCCPVLSMPGGGYRNHVSLQCMNQHIELLETYGK